MKNPELLFISWPGAGHLGSTVDMAKLLVNHDTRISITLLIFKLPFDSKSNSFIDSLCAATPISDRINLIQLPSQDPHQNGQPVNTYTSIIESLKPHVREITSTLIRHSDSTRLAGFVLDIFCTSMADIAQEFGVPSYIFFMSSAAFLGFMLHIQYLHDEQGMDPTRFKNLSDGNNIVLDVPFFSNQLPAKVLPSVVLTKEWLPFLLGHARKMREMKGVLVNTFAELEPYAVESFSTGPLVFPVGPTLNLHGDNVGGAADRIKEIMEWLDNQPPLSVVFLCFGSMGSFDADQVKEIARALEHSEHRFLWSLRRPPEKGKAMDSPSDYEDPGEVLPEGFLDRTGEMGKIIGWAPQTAVLTHPAVGGFVSHCGWNSTLESVCFGVPIATWPMYAEQQLNAFEMVVELGLAVEIKMDYRKSDLFGDEGETVSAEEIERGIRRLMEVDSEMRKKVKEMSENSRKALMTGGSSFNSLDRFIEDLLQNNNIML